MHDERPPAVPLPEVRRRRSAPEARDWRRRVLTIALTIVLCVLVVNAFVGEKGYLATVRAGRERDALLVELANIRIENQRLRDERVRLDQDPSALEEAARRQLGLIRPGETLVIVHDAAPADPPPSTK